MKCEQVTEMLSEYWDLPDNDAGRVMVDQHIASCRACREEFEIWQESSMLIQTAKPIQLVDDRATIVASDVMSRIYKDEAWRMPVAFRSYTFSYKVRRNIMACIAMCLAVFVVSFIYSFGMGTDEQDFTSYTGIIETAHAKSLDLSSQKQGIFDGAPVASISAPSLLTVGPIQSYTDYLLAASIVGFVITLLLMNWLSRLRA